MRKKECPSCAMEIDANSKVCPICSYEFATYSSGLKWVAILLIVVIILYFVL